MKTEQRKTIMKYLSGNSEHPTVKDIYEALSKVDINRISIATIYNTLNLMKKKGMIREIAVPGVDYKRYDPNMKAHAHIICTDCGKIVDIDHSLNIELSTDQKKGFVIQDTELIFHGTCPDCVIQENFQDNEPSAARSY